MKHLKASLSVLVVTNSLLSVYKNILKECTNKCKYSTEFKDKSTSNTYISQYTARISRSQQEPHVFT